MLHMDMYFLIHGVFSCKVVREKLHIHDFAFIMSSPCLFVLFYLNVYLRICKVMCIFSCKVVKEKLNVQASEEKRKTKNVFKMALFTKKKKKKSQFRKSVLVTYDRKFLLF